EMEIVRVGVRRIRQRLPGLCAPAGPTAHHLRLQFIAGDRTTRGRRIRYCLTEDRFERRDVLPKLAYHQKTSILEQIPDPLRLFTEGTRLVRNIWIAAQQFAEMDLIAEANARLAFVQHRVRIGVDKAKVLLRFAVVIAL